MSGQEGPKPKRALPLVNDKGLMPEILPDPLQAKATGPGPRDRVRKRLAQITERAAAIAAAASLSAGCSDSHTASNAETDGGAGSAGTHSAGKGGAGGFSGVGGSAGYGVVDPLPPPAGSGGFGGFAGTTTAGTGVGGSAGYGVVDPMPDPFVCPAPPAADVTVTSAVWSGDSIVIQLQLTDVRAQGLSTLETATAESGVRVVVNRAFGNVTLTLTAANGWPDPVDLFLGFHCKAEFGAVNYQFHVRLFPSGAHTGNVPFTLVTDDMDAGI